ncbi:hypothetical protein [Bradyrhizobium uaiense]|uniref:Uncharacterized protein n=1 Tax=Bradyrhizobium uaiense TaxID=2594946 RepID=A0A6P1B7H6_9BRAD|nr:hypothetical protein [Bradyrhizobium uaiense]NEU94527.1 hypothetical protein [Bradyrhizobium uaiense]
MASLIGDLIAAVLEFAFWAAWEILPALCFFTALAVVFAATLGKVTIERRGGRIGWTGVPRITRSPQGRMVLSASLGVIIGFVFWVIVVSAAIIFHAYQS